MLEYHFSRTYPGARRPRHGCAWRNHVILTRVFESAQEREELWAAVGNAPMEHDMQSGPRPEQLPRPNVPDPDSVQPLYITPSLLDLLYQLDGFTVYDCRSVKGVGTWVYVRRGDELPTYVHQDLNTSHTSANVSKHHFLMLIGPCGFLCCVAMKSGTKLWRGKGRDQRARVRRTSGTSVHDELNGEASEYRFWCDYITEWLADEDMPDGETAQDVQNRMASKQWMVCPHVHVSVASLRTQHVPHCRSVVAVISRIITVSSNDVKFRLQLLLPISHDITDSNTNKTHALLLHCLLLLAIPMHCLVKSPSSAHPILSRLMLVINPI